ncbi:hypothetical protein [Mesorhizobium sp. KR2-14]|uniref:hypothetical protein n=1 Tax=Mesorhizobium sp. KR2-14 TaxID=3156610 RepID=UPI0032B47430
MTAKHFREDRFKIGLRFVAWLVQYSWLKRQLAYDPLFICTLFLSPKDVAALADFVGSNRGRAEELTAASDLVCLYANLAHAALLDGRREEYEKWRALHALEMVAGLPLAQAEKPRRTRLAEEIGQQARHVSTSDADTALKDFSDVCKALDIEWFAVSGTFLGIVREKDWLAHDYDIDVGIMSDLFTADAIVEALIQKGHFSVQKYDLQVHFFGPDGAANVEEVPACLKLIHRSGVPVDVFIHYVEGDVCWHGSSMNRWDNSRFDLISYSFRGFSVLGPADHDRYLTENYGPGWRVPVVEFHSTDGSGTPNLVLVRNLFSLGICLKRLSCVDEPTRRRLVAMMTAVGAISVEAGQWVYNIRFCGVDLNHDVTTSLNFREISDSAAPA